MTKRLIILIASLILVVPFVFYGCSGDDGATGATGAKGDQGDPGAPGPPGTGIVADETCVLCHGAGKTENVASVHRIAQSPGTMTVTIQSVTFGTPVGDNVPVTVDFTFAATNSAGDNITSQIDLTTPATNTATLPNNSTDNLAYIRFSLAQLTAGQNGSPNEWAGFVVTPGASGSGPFSTANKNGVNGAAFTYSTATGVGSYTFRTSAIRISDGYTDNLVTRAFIQVSGVPFTRFTSDPYFNTNLRRPVANAVKDVVSGVGTKTDAPGAAYPVKNDVSTQACNTCHDPLGIHGGGRREYKACQVCHNAKLQTAAGGSWDNSNLVNLVHKIHNSAGGTRFAGVQDIGELVLDEPIAYPQAINNCRKCHQGPEATDNTYNNFQNRPSRVACGSCHFKVDFVTGTGHLVGAQPDDSGCALSSCHTPAKILGYHAAKEGAPTTPNNPTLATGLKDVRYAISSATVDDNNAVLIKFQIKIDNVVANLGNAGDNTARPAVFNSASQPSFLLAYTLPQDGVNAPADYNNRGKRAAQPQSVSIINLPITANDNTWTTVKIANAFPAGAKMRAVALQGYFTQPSVAGVDVNPDDGIPDNVARHTPSVMVPVTGDAVRRTVVKSGYVDGKPVGCLECHEVFEGHGGNRVNNAQVCVMCHNPNLTSSGRIIDPTNATTAASPVFATIKDFIDNDGDPATVGTDPLTYPEITNNFKELIHGIHAGEMRVNEFVDIRGERLALIAGDEILYPGDLSHCTKCHDGTTYQEVQVKNILLTTEKVTTGIAGETRLQISGARDTVPNETDLVNSATSSACGYCHDTSTDVSHFIAQGGNIKTKRADAKVAPPLLMPVADITP